MLPEIYSFSFGLPERKKVKKICKKRRPSRTARENDTEVKSTWRRQKRKILTFSERFSPKNALEMCGTVLRDFVRFCWVNWSGKTRTNRIWNFNLNYKMAASFEKTRRGSLTFSGGKFSWIKLLKRQQCCWRHIPLALVYLERKKK